MTMDAPLHWAVKKGNLRVCWMLLKAGFSLENVDSVGNPPLHLAASAAPLPLLACFVAHGAAASLATRVPQRHPLELLLLRRRAAQP